MECEVICIIVQVLACVWVRMSVQDHWNYQE